ncbi:alkaline phosphatase family protein [Streptomyces sp. NPDC001843]|uniref:alkaline phosphatase family protein n=1 Tax=Streptomyces sp. NPDC001843 TaxID=3364617 RepID=UPI0036991A0E
MRRRAGRLLLAAQTAVMLVLAAGAPADAAGAHQPRTPIRHFVYLMQGDRTFDQYFGTYPGADGLPADTCQARDLAHPHKGCVKPYALHGKAAPAAALAAGKTVIERQYDGGKMDGFVAAYERQGRDGAAAMGHYDRRDLPFYWNAADRYQLFDHFFASARQGTRADRAYWVAGGAALSGRTTIFDRLQAAGVSWKFYVEDYDPKQTFRQRSEGDPATQTVRVPLLDSPRFVDDPELRGHIVDLNQYYVDLEHGRLPAVAYIASSGAGERSARSVPAGQRLVRNLTTQLMLSGYWNSSALLWSYDGSGGWYDHVAPPPGYGFRVPALLVSPYVPRGRVEHTVFDATSALRFVEENWGLKALGGRDTKATSLGRAFDFRNGPRPADIIPATTTAPVALRPVRSAMVYGVYGGAVGIAALLVLTAAVGQRLTKGVRSWRRRAR